MFANLVNLKEFVSFNNLSTIYTSDMSHMFYNCYKLTKIDFKNFSTARVTTMYEMFRNCLVLGSGSNGIVDLSSFNTSKVTNMYGMFRGLGDMFSPTGEYNEGYSSSFKMTGIQQIIFGNNFNTSNVTNMSAMFYNDTNLRKLNVENFDTSKVVDMSWMFSQCNNLGNKYDSSNNEISWMKDWELDLSKWNTSKVKNFKRMFLMANRLPSIKFGKNFTLDSATRLEGMFASCNKLTTLDLSSFKNVNPVTIGANPYRHTSDPLIPTEFKWWANGMFFGNPLLETIDMRNFDFCNVTLVSKAILDDNPHEYFLDPNSSNKVNSHRQFDDLIKTKGYVFMRTGMNNATNHKVTVIVGDEYVDNNKKKCIDNIVENNTYSYSHDNPTAIDTTQETRMRFVTADGLLVWGES